MTHLKASSHSKGKGKKWFQDEHHRGFIMWLHELVSSKTLNTLIYSKFLNPIKIINSNDCGGIQVANKVAISTHQISERLKWLAHGPSNQVLKYQSYMINGVTYHTKERDDMRVVQNSGVKVVAKIMQVSSAKDKNPVVSDMVFYGVIQEIWEIDYHDFRIPMFKCNWVENNNGVKVDDIGFTLVNLNRIGFKSDPFILGSQARQVFYIEDPQDSEWSVVLATPSRDYFEYVNDDDLGDTVINFQCFSKGLSSMDVDGADENEPPCIREDCDGTWVDNIVS